jgi:hypothetical protein
MILILYSFLLCPSNELTFVIIVLVASLVFHLSLPAPKEKQLGMQKNVLDLW